MGAFQPVAFQTNFQQDATVATFDGPTIADLTLPKSVPMSRNFSGRFSGPGLVFSSSGTLPPGLSVSAAGVLSGTPTTPGAYPTIRIIATDSGSNVAQSNTFTITVITANRGDIGASNVGGADLGTADEGAADVDTPGWWVG